MSSTTIKSARQIRATVRAVDPSTFDLPIAVLGDSYGNRFTEQRAEKAARVVVNSVVFRSSGQNLTVLGTYIEMASRFFEPALRALALLAIRGRVKR